MDFESLMETASKNNKKSKKRIEKLPEEDEKLKAFSKNVGRSERAKIEQEAEEYAKKELKKKLAAEKLRLDEAKVKEAASKKAALEKASTKLEEKNYKKRKSEAEGPAPDAIQAFLARKKKLEEKKREEEAKKREEVQRTRSDKKPRRSLQDARIRMPTHTSKSPPRSSIPQRPSESSKSKPAQTAERKHSQPDPSESIRKDSKSKPKEEDKRVKKLNRPMPKSKKLAIMAEVLHDEISGSKGKPKSKITPKIPPPSDAPQSFQELMMMASDINKKTTLNDLNPDGSIKIKKPPPPPPSPKISSISKHSSHHSEFRHKKKSELTPPNSSSSHSSASSQASIASHSSKSKSWGPKSKHKLENPSSNHSDSNRHGSKKLITSSSSSKFKSHDSIPSSSSKPGPASSKRPLDASAFDADAFEKFKKVKMAELKREFMEMQKKKHAAQIMRGRGNEDEEDSDYDSDMDGFIDDSEEFGGQDEAELERTIKEAFNYDKRRFANEKWSKDDDRAMESNYRQMQAEEARSSKIGKLEDLQELLREQGKLGKTGKKK